MSTSTDTETKTTSEQVSIEQEQTREQGEAPIRRAPRLSLSQFWSFVLLPLLLTRLLLELVGTVTVYYLLPLINKKQPIYPDLHTTQLPNMFWLMWYHFDSGFYLSIAQGGYWDAASLKHMSNWAFFPLYPVLMHILGLPFGESTTALQIAGLAISLLATVVAGLYLYKITAFELNPTAGIIAVCLLALFPTGFYLTAIYPESLALALTIACLYYARLHRWWLSGLCGGLAALTHPQGVFLVIVVAWEYWQALADRWEPLRPVQGIVTQVQEWIRSRLIGFLRSLQDWRTLAGFVALLLIPVGLGLFCLYGKWQVNTFLPFEEVEKNGWGRSFSNPILLILHMLHHPRPTSPYDWNFYGLNMTAVIVFLLLLIPIFRKLPAIYGIFSLIFVLMPLTVGETNSITRFYLGIFPVYMLIAWWCSKNSEKQVIRTFSICVTFALLLALGMTMFTLGVYSMS